MEVELTEITEGDLQDGCGNSGKQVLPQCRMFPTLHM